MRYEQYARDLATVIGLAIISLAVGMIANRFRATPLPLLYHSKQQRLDAQLEQLIHKPPFKVSDADFIGIDRFREIVTQKKAVIIDAREKPFYTEGHVPGAINLSRANFAEDYRRLGPTLKRDHQKLIVVYCSGGACHDSKMVASALLSLGFQRVEVFTGGWEDWSKAGLPVSHG